jgi:hypothetical protein
MRRASKPLFAELELLGQLQEDCKDILPIETTPFGQHAVDGLASIAPHVSPMVERSPHVIRMRPSQLMRRMSKPMFEELELLGRIQEDYKDIVPTENFKADV